MEERITRLENELRQKIGLKGENDDEDGVAARRNIVAATKADDELEDLKRDELQGDETSSDGGIESGTDDLSEK
jgi:hypothetical protein